MAQAGDCNLAPIGPGSRAGGSGCARQATGRDRCLEARMAPLRGLRLHDLRHQAITAMAEAGASDATLMAVAGHMSRRMLEHRSHVRMAAKRMVLDKLESGLMDKPP